MCALMSSMSIDCSFKVAMMASSLPPFYGDGVVAEVANPHRPPGVRVSDPVPFSCLPILTPRTLAYLLHLLLLNQERLNYRPPDCSCWLFQRQRGRALHLCMPLFAHDAISVGVVHVLVCAVPRCTGAMPCARASAQVILPFSLSSHRARASTSVLVVGLL